MPVKDLCRKHGFSEASYYLWRSKFGGMSVPEALQDAPFGGVVEDEIDGPDLIRGSGPEQWLPVGRRHLFPFPSAHLQVRLLVQALDSFVIDHLTGLAELQVDHADAVAFMAIGQRADHLAQIDVGVGRGSYR